jgi:23S rRNA (guanosine2251-2'-O)-methyltransferase
MRRKLRLEELNRLTPEAFSAQDKIPLLFVLDNIRSGLNVGSAFRTGDAFGITEIVLCGITAQPPHKEILKTAIGANETVSWRHEKDIVRAMEALKRDGVWLVACEQTTDSKPLFGYDFAVEKPVALIFGNEVDGVSDGALALADEVLEIPQYGTKHSLNVSVSIGIFAAEYRRQWDLSHSK